MKTILIHIIVIFISLNLLSAQQDLQFTQFLNAKEYLNPAMVGHEYYTQLKLRTRTQWAGIEGRPEARTLMLNLGRLYNALGFGLNINDQSIGITKRTDLTGIYTYHLNMGDKTLSLGLQSSLSRFKKDFTDERIFAIDGVAGDPRITELTINQNIFNVGFGLNYQTENYSIGLSVPRLVKSAIGTTGMENNTTEVRHAYLMLAAELPLGQQWDINPGILLKVPEEAPFDLDFQSVFSYNQQLHLGINIRAGGTQSTIFESMGLLIGLNIGKNLLASLSYDFTATPIREFEDGSFELLLSYSFLPKVKLVDIQNPRIY